VTVCPPREERRRTWRAAARLIVGAMLLHASALGAQQAMFGRVEGAARAGTEGRLARDVSVTLTRLEPEPVTTLTTTTDSLGRYRIDSLTEGRYLLEASSPLLDSLQLAIGAREVRVVAGETARADIALPSDAAVHAALAEAEQGPTSASVDTTTGGLLLTGSASLAGRVTGTTNEPIAGVQLSVRDARGTATSDSSGRFVLSGLPAGAQVLVARRLGYALAERVVELRAGQRAAVDLRLERMAALDSMRVTALGGRYREFEFNRGANIFGRYLTRDQILRRRPADSADLLYRLGGFTVIGHGGAATVYSKRELRKPEPCPANVVIDGVQGRRINDVRPLRIVGLEAYEGPGTFTSDYDSKCGLIVIWTSAWRAAR
jgi:hypothetical protein